MDIAVLSMELSSASLLSQASTAVLAKSLKQSEITGQNMIKALECSVTPHLGQSIDLTL